MDANEDLLDTPLEETGTLIKRSPRYTSMGILKLDFGISALLIVLSLLAGIVALFDTGIIMLVMIIGFFLGSYQLLSALIGGIRGNRKKLVYLAAALGYLFVFYGLFAILEYSLDSTFLRVIAIIGLMIIPLIFAFYYAKLCYDVIKEQELYD
ncbi:hypothetical protein [Lewinella sp. LCG006]|uniref:hypothetical protein n=1 Tax=Lewinella sp. LCG006 TaxID=3231911 RepID=UPI00345F9A0F